LTRTVSRSSARAIGCVAMIALVGWVPTPTPTGEGVVRAMHDRYAARWYHTLTFVQTTTRHRPSGDTVQTWYESVSVPGKLRIDIGPLSAGNGVLFSVDSTYRVEHGALTKVTAGGNPLLTLAFDVYGQPVDTTLAQLRRAGFDLTKVHADVWRSRPAWVVGADSGDTVAAQFWIDRERLVLLRHKAKELDVRFNDYQRAGGGWLAPNVDILVNGVLVQHEQYTVITPNRPLSGALFDPHQWSSAPHWAPTS
jgi:hypothetical protein